MEIKLVCPLGSECESAKDGYIERCRWFVEMRGQDASGKEHDSWKCAIEWFPILQVEVAGTQRGVAASVQSLRNMQSDKHDSAMKLLKGGNNVKTITTG